jgi:hypothetical protein
MADTAARRPSVDRSKPSGTAAPTFAELLDLGPRLHCRAVQFVESLDFGPQPAQIGERPGRPSPAPRDGPGVGRGRHQVAAIARHRGGAEQSPQAGVVGTASTTVQQVARRSGLQRIVGRAGRGERASEP